MAAVQKLYDLIKGCNTQIKGFAKRGFTDCTFSASLFFGKKQLNGIESAAIENFSALLRDYYKTEQPDRIKLEFYGHGLDNTKRMLYSKTYEFSDEPAGRSLEAQDTRGEKNLFAGFGEAEVLEMVDKKVSEIERARELDRTKTELETLRREHEDLLRKNEELNATITAQSTIETYANIAGKAAPILSAIFGTNPLVATATSLLAGIGSGESQATTGKLLNRAIARPRS